jgi:CubicO group peptidase (beta-lactamase class C family)
LVREDERLHRTHFNQSGSFVVMKTLLRVLFACSIASVFMSAAATADDSPAGAFTPERVKAATAELEKLAQQTLKGMDLPGIAIAVVHRDRVVYKQGFGVREAGKPDAIDADTVFQLASVSKPLSSTVLAAIVGEGRISWDDRVIDHDASFRMYDPYVTRELRLRDLLCHRSGLPDHAGDLLEDLGFDRNEILRRLRYQPPDSSFRA